MFSATSKALTANLWIAAVLLGLLFMPGAAWGQATDLEMLRVSIVGPERVAAGQEFEVTINIGNTGEQTLTLDSIDVHDEWLAGIRVLSVAPASVEDPFHIPIDNSVSFTMRQQVPPKANLSVIFRLIGAKAGTFTGNIDICTTPVVCKPVSITTSVTGSVPPGVVIPDGKYPELEIPDSFGDSGSGGDSRHNALDLQFLTVDFKIPQEVNVGTTFDLVFNLKNNADRTIFIDSIDVHDEYLANLTIVKSNPPSQQEVFHIPVDNSMSYTMKQSIPAGQSLTVTFTCVANSPGIHAGNIDVCVTYADCHIVPVSIRAK